MDKYKERFSKYEKNRWTGLTISLCVVVVFYMLLSHIGSMKDFFNSFFAITSTVIIGAVIAYTANPLASWIYRHIEKKFKDNHKNSAWVISAVASLTTILLLIVVLIILITPRLIENITAFARGLTGYIDSFKQLVIDSELEEQYKLSILGFVDEQTDLTMLVSKVFGGDEITPGWFISFSAGTVSKAFGFMIGIILAYYFLCAKKKLSDTLGEFFYLIIPSSHYSDWKNICNRLNAIFSRFIVCELVDALIVGIVNAVFMFATGMPYAVFCSVVVALTNLAPTFGPFVGAFIGAVILLLAKPDSVIIWLVFTLALQLIDGYVIKPRLFGSALNVPPFLVLVFLVVGGKIWGVPGVLLAIPLAAILTYIYNEIVLPWLKDRKKVKDETKAKENLKAKKEKIQKDSKADQT
ncbi:MAG: AI-2E family transporter [Clostridiales bacterium]|jgi:predicted PurR-regulated permease PerM|nr:AI-2E family transporter [Clostridiales bacterium]